MKTEKDDRSIGGCSPEPRLPFSRFDSRTVPTAQRFELVRGLLGSLYSMESLSASHDRRFDVEMSGWRLDGLLLGTTHLTHGQTRFVRHPYAGQYYDGEPFQLFYYKRGGFRGSNGGHELVVGAGDIAVLDLACELDIEHSPQSEHVTLLIPRDVFLPCLDERPYGGMVLRRDRVRTQLLAHHLNTVLTMLPRVGVEDASAIAQGLLGLISASVETASSPDEERHSTLPHAMLKGICDYIEITLVQPTLSVATLCQRFHCSRAYLYRLFQPLGGVRHYIQERRLQRCLRLLSHAESRRRRVTDIALEHGFTNQSHFSRLFKERFGISPSDARDTVHMKPLPAFAREWSSELERPSFYDWLTEL